MHLIILPGNSKKYNKQWLYDSENAYKDLFETTTTCYYKHWKENRDSINFDFEVQKLVEEIEKINDNKSNKKNKKGGNADYIIYAKSVGTVITTKALAQNLISPQKCIFVGSPFPWAIENDSSFKEKFNKIKVPTLFIQQTNDPFFKYKRLEEFLEKNPLKNYHLIEIEGNNHAYDNYKEIKKMIKDFI